MKIKDLSFITEVTEENTNTVNGGSDPFEGLGTPSMMFVQANNNSAYIANMMGLPEMGDFYQSMNDLFNVQIVPTQF